MTPIHMSIPEAACPLIPIPVRNVDLLAWLLLPTDDWRYVVAQYRNKQVYCMPFCTGARDAAKIELRDRIFHSVYVRK